jgi:hypothetical protein
MAYFDDDGNELNPNLISKPVLCISCLKNELQSEELLCNLNRLDQKNEVEFKCAAYENLNID